jgi:hypothetical protein
MRPIAARKLIVGGRAFHMSWLDVTLTPHWTPRGPRVLALCCAPTRSQSVQAQNRKVAVNTQDRKIGLDVAPRRYAAVGPLDNLGPGIDYVFITSEAGDYLLDPDGNFIVEG